MTDIYLILHKVRGKPAFDIAEKIMIGEEEGWIIPTSGHRAFPMTCWPLNQLWPDLSCPNTTMEDILITCSIGPDWPDHYQTTKEPPFKLNVRQLLAGFRPTLNFKRRI
jgi:hypothetical protein